MTEDDALPIRQGSAWRLLLEFLAPGGVAGEDDALQRIAEAVLELDLQPAQRARIERAVVETLRKAAQRDSRARHNSPVLIRVWFADLFSAEAASDRECQIGRPQTNRGSGFFLLERQTSDPCCGELEANRQIELYVYQESARAE